MNIYLNGNATEAADCRNITELIQHFGLSPQAVLIEHNGLALHRREWPDRLLGEGDRVEIIRVVAGG